ncbi:MAG: hypothetical protein MJ082_02370 [Clostridia bacterium]|nr:hypothetical protein [Clostridia bacterium]
MKSVRFVIKALIFIFSVLYFLIVAVLPFQILVEAKDLAVTLQNYWSLVLEMLPATPIFLLLLFSLLFANSYSLYRHSEISQEKFKRRAVLFTAIILLQVAAVIVYAVLI